MAYLKVKNERECVLRVECRKLEQKRKHERPWECNLKVARLVSGGTGFVTYADFGQREKSIKGIMSTLLLHLLFLSRTEQTSVLTR